MHRRTALKKLGIITGGMVLLPSCNFSEEKASVILKNLKVTAEQEKVLKAIISTLIPEGEIPGAIALGVDHFVWIMIDDILTEKRQKKFIKELNLFNSEILRSHGKSYDKLSKKDQTEVLIKTLEESKNNDIINCIKITKNYTERGYMQSKYIMSEIMPYSLVPGSYGNCVETDPKKRINIYG